MFLECFIISLTSLKNVVQRKRNESHGEHEGQDDCYHTLLTGPLYVHIDCLKSDESGDGRNQAVED